MSTKEKKNRKSSKHSTHSKDLLLNEEKDQIEKSSQEDQNDEQDFYNSDLLPTLHPENPRPELSDQEEEDLEKQSEEFKAKSRKSGVIFISYIPEGLTISLIRKKLQDYGVQRVYLKPISGKKGNFKEGWIEFADKIMAKLCEYELNGQPIGGKKRDPISDELWTFKYLHKFKWHHLVEKMQLQQKIKEQELKTSINQAHRENQFIMESYQQSKRKRTKLEHNPELNEDEKVETIKKGIKQIRTVAKK
mmetsp:Transcript_31623/g.32846  ORF Transcript_31623/g.32846 Transcript_31623/m.32846 type:complete len:248 (+) Transcript_31623:11-754(+)